MRTIMSTPQWHLLLFHFQNTKENIVAEESDSE
jgi:hypothetical protein